MWLLCAVVVVVVAEAVVFCRAASSSSAACNSVYGGLTMPIRRVHAGKATGLCIRAPPRTGTHAMPPTTRYTHVVARQGFSSRALTRCFGQRTVRGLHTHVGLHPAPHPPAQSKAMAIVHLPLFVGGVDILQLFWECEPRVSSNCNRQENICSQSLVRQSIVPSSPTRCCNVVGLFRHLLPHKQQSTDHQASPLRTLAN